MEQSRWCGIIPDEVGNPTPSTNSSDTRSPLPCYPALHDFLQCHHHGCRRVYRSTFISWLPQRWSACDSQLFLGDPFAVPAALCGKIWRQLTSITQESTSTLKSRCAQALAGARGTDLPVCRVAHAARKWENASVGDKGRKASLSGGLMNGSARGP